MVPSIGYIISAKDCITFLPTTETLIMDGYYSTSESGQSVRWPIFSDPMPKVKLNSEGGIDETYIEVTVGSSGNLGRTWRWQLLTKGKVPTLVPQGEVYNSELEGAIGTTPAPTHISGTNLVDNHIPGASWPTPEASPAVKHFGSYPVITHVSSAETTWVDQTSDEDEYFGNNNYTMKSQSSEGRNDYSFPQRDIAWSTPRSVRIEKKDVCQEGKKSKRDKKKKH